MVDAGLQTPTPVTPVPPETPLAPPAANLPPPPPPVQPETPLVTPPINPMAKGIKKHGKKIIAGTLMFMLLAGGAWFGVNEVQRRQQTESLATKPDPEEIISVHSWDDVPMNEEGTNSVLYDHGCIWHVNGVIYRIDEECGGDEGPSCPSDTELICGSPPVNTCTFRGTCMTLFPSRFSGSACGTTDQPGKANCQTNCLCCPTGSTYQCHDNYKLTVYSNWVELGEKQGEPRFGWENNRDCKSHGDVKLSEVLIAEQEESQRTYELTCQACDCQTASPSPSPSPSASPSPSPTLSCVDLTSDKAQPGIGDDVTFTCEASYSNMSAARAFFRTSSDNGTSWSANIPFAGVPVNTTTKKADQNITIDKTGNWMVQCRICDDAAVTCTPWGQAQ